MFEAARRHELHADANAQKRFTFLDHRFVQRVNHSIDGVEAAPAIGKRADAGKHDALGLANVFRIAGQSNFHAAAALPRGALQRFMCRVQIAGAVIDDGDAHHVSASGKVPMTRSRVDTAGVTGRNTGPLCCAGMPESQRA